MVGSGLTILCNVVQHELNKAEVAFSPLFHLLTNGATLNRAYTFLPPYTSFEILVLAVLLIGGYFAFSDQV